MNDKNNNSGGLGLTSVLTVVFVVLKLIGVIKWKWVWVLSPLWISTILVILLFIGMLVYMIHEDKRYEPHRNKKNKNKRKF